MILQRVCQRVGAAGLLMAALSPALANEHQNLSLLLRVQPEAVNASGDIPDRRGSSGTSITDGWGNGVANSHNWGAFFADAHHRFNDDWRLFARYGLNVDMEGVKSGDAREREVEIGLNTPIGEFRAGRLETPYKLAALGWDPLNATFLQARANTGRSGGAFGHGGYVDNALGYAHQFGVVKVNAFAAVDRLSNVGSGLSDENLAWAFSLSAPLGPVELLLSHIDASRFDGAPGDRTGTKLGARWQDGAWTLAGHYEFRGEGLENGDFLFLTTSYRHQQWQFSLNHGRFSEDERAGDDARYYALGARYSVSPLISFHGGVRRVERDLSGNEHIAGLGARFTFRTGNLLASD
ncbi:MAG: porin [Wenzhouxiangella sp.]